MITTSNILKCLKIHKSYPYLELSQQEIEYKRDTWKIDEKGMSSLIQKKTMGLVEELQKNRIFKTNSIIEDMIIGLY